MIRPSSYVLVHFFPAIQVNRNIQLVKYFFKNAPRSNNNNNTFIVKRCLRLERKFQKKIRA